VNCPAQFHPDTGLFYVNATRAFSATTYSMKKKSRRLGRQRPRRWAESMLQADRLQNRRPPLEPQMGRRGIRSGVLSTAGNLLFTGDTSSNLVALTASTGQRSGMRISAPA